MWTDAEARKKHCPLIKSACVGVNCMSWRWTDERVPLVREEIVAARSAYGIAAALKPRTFKRGYCGAFGEPSALPETDQAEEHAA